jgi:hypothetical protein
VGKHAAPEGASGDPLVIAALASRPQGAAHSHDGQGENRPGGESEVGWPAPPAPDGGGLGWPADAGKAAADAVAPTRPAGTAGRGSRRLFRASRVA